MFRHTTMQSPASQYRLPRHRMKCLSVLVAGALCASLAQAQLLRGLQDRLADAVERRVEQQVEERVVQEVEQSATGAVDQTFESLFGAAGAAGAEGQSLLGSMLDTSNVEVRDEYRFNIAATFDIQTFDGRGRPSGDPMELVFHYADDAPYTGTRVVSGDVDNAGAAMIIYDFDNSVMLMLMDAEGSRFAMPYSWDMAAAGVNEAWDLADGANASADAAMPAFEHIGSRTISGYKSEGYRFQDEENVSEIWVSEDVAPGIGRIFQANRSLPILGGSMPQGYPQGMIMEMNSENTSTGERVEMRTRRIDTEANLSYRMSDYPIMNLGAMGGMGR